MWSKFLSLIRISESMKHWNINISKSIWKYYRPFLEEFHVTTHTHKKYKVCAPRELEKGESIRLRIWNTNKETKSFLTQICNLFVIDCQWCKKIGNNYNIVGMQ